MTGTYAALGAVAAYREARRCGQGEHVDVAMLDCMAVTMVTYPSVFASFAGWPEQHGTGRVIEVPSVEPSKDGYFNVTTNSAQQFQDFLLMIGRPDLLEDPDLAQAAKRFARRDEFLAAVHAHTTQHTTAELLDEASLFRIPAGPVLDGSTMPEFEQFVARGVFEPNPSGRFVQPRVPFGISGTHHDRSSGLRRRVRTPGRSTGRLVAGIVRAGRRRAVAAPLGRHPGHRLHRLVGRTGGRRRPVGLGGRRDQGGVGRQAGLHALRQHPPADRRPVVGVGADLPRGQRQQARHHARPDAAGRGRGLRAPRRHRPTSSSRTYTPRVMEQFGLGWERMHEVNPDLIMVRMPAFGLSGPWRDRTGFAQTMECLTGMAWLTGFPDGPPVLVRGACDPLAGMHAVIATLLALIERDQSGRWPPGGDGHGGGGAERGRRAGGRVRGHRHGAAPRRQPGTGGRPPGGLPVCRGRSLAGPRRRHRRTVEVAARRCRRRRVGRRHRVGHGRGPAAPPRCARRRAGAVDGRHRRRRTGHRADGGRRARLRRDPLGEIVANPQLRSRRLFEVEPHAVTGDHEVPMLPFRFSRVDHWLRSPAPTLGQHNTEVLSEIGLAPSDIDQLRRAGIVGETLGGS